MSRVSILVTHLLGSGHLSRALTLAHAFRAVGHETQMISGGLPASHLGANDPGFVQIVPVHSDGTNFTSLLDDKNRPVTPAQMAQRSGEIVYALNAFVPDVLITELFPFGRRVLRDEFLAALEAMHDRAKPPLVFASIRDILAPPSSEKKAAQTHAWVDRFYDGVLVHSDRKSVPVEASWPVTPELAKLLHYTGFIARSEIDVRATDEGRGEILVTAGGGPVGRKLFEISVEAARLIQGRRWRLLVGGADAASVCARLNAAAGANVHAEPVRPDYRALLRQCAAAVGQCGYNTAIDWLQAGVPGVFVPFAEGGEVEQSLRAALLQARYGYGTVAEEDLSAQSLATAVDGAISRGPVEAGGLKLDGADETCRIVERFLEQRT